MYYPAVWLCVETNIGVVCACLPALGPVISCFRSRFFGSGSCDAAYYGFAQDSPGFLVGDRDDTMPTAADRSSGLGGGHNSTGAKRPKLFSGGRAAVKEKLHNGWFSGSGSTQGTNSRGTTADAGASVEDIPMGPIMVQREFVVNWEDK